jgi:hypothetical protein
MQKKVTEDLVRVVSALHAHELCKTGVLPSQSKGPLANTHGLTDR